MRIRFEPTGATASLPSGRVRPTIERDWPVVPRVGDVVELWEAEELYFGVVAKVGWFDGPGGLPEVRVRIR